MTISTRESSMAMEEIRNLEKVGLDHTRTCKATDTSECDVSLFLLKQTAKRLVKLVMPYEVEEAETLIGRMP